MLKPREQHWQTASRDIITSPAKDSVVMIVSEVPDEIDSWSLISSYSTDQAEADGVLARVGYLGSGEVVYFTANLLAQGYEDGQKRMDLVNRGLNLLNQPDPEDTEYMRLRVIEKDQTWVIHEPGKLTYLKPEDY